MKTNWLLSIVLFLLLIITSNSHADQNLRRLILQDCSSALLEFQRLPHENRVAMLPYLRDLLRLEDDSLSGMALPGSLDSTAGGLEAIPLAHQTLTWRKLSMPSRYDAKECAVYLLGTLAPHSIESLPELLMVADDLGAPDSLRDLAWDTAQVILSRYENALPLPLALDTIKGLLEWFQNSGSSRVKDTVRRLGSRIAPQLLFSLSSCAESTCLALVSLLASIEDPAYLIDNLDVLRAIIGRSSAALRAELYAFIVQSHSQNSELLKLVAAGFDDTELAVRMRIFGEIEASSSRGEEIAVSEPLFIGLIHTLSAHSAQEGVAAYNALIGERELIANFSGEIGDLLERSNDTQLSLKAISLLKNAPQLNSRGFKALTNKTYSKIEQLRQAAIDSLSTHRERTPEVMNNLGRLLKSLRAGKDLETYQKAAYESASAFINLEAPVDETSFIPYFIDALAIDPEMNQPHAAMRALERFGKSAKIALTKATRSTNAKISSRAKMLLSQKRA